MKKYILFFVTTIFALVAGSTFECKAPQQFSSQFVSAPFDSSCFSTANAASKILYSENSPASSFVSEPNVFNNILSNKCSGTSSTNVCNNIFSTGSTVSLPTASENSVDNVFCSASSGSGIQPYNEIQPVVYPAIEGPAITLPSPPIPPARVLSEKCVCTKTILRPQIYKRTIIVPKLQRYIRKTYTPVIENIAYKAFPVPQPESSSASIAFTSGSGSLLFDPKTRFVSTSSPVVIPSENVVTFPEGPHSEFISSSTPIIVSSESQSLQCDPQNQFISSSPDNFSSMSVTSTPQTEFSFSSSPVIVSSGSCNSQSESISSSAFSSSISPNSLSMSCDSQNEFPSLSSPMVVSSKSLSTSCNPQPEFFPLSSAVIISSESGSAPCGQGTKLFSV